MLSGLFLAEMSLDRMLAVRFPMKAASLCSTTRAKVTVVLTTVVIVAINVHLMFALKYVSDPILGKASKSPMIITKTAREAMLTYGYCRIWREVQHSEPYAGSCQIASYKLSYDMVSLT
jgi:hypothetical protein